MPGYGEYLEIEERLRDDLGKARAEYQTARREFHTLVQDMPLEIPQPDGETLIQQTGQASRLALQKYSRALKRFSQYTLSGIVPKDLLPLP